jgi:hypothetical protein
MDAVGESEAKAEGFEGGAFGTVADEGACEIDSLEGQLGEGFEKDAMPFGGHHAAGADKTDGANGFCARLGGDEGFKGRIVDAQADDRDFAVIEAGRDAENLAAAEVADAEDEAGRLDFLAQVKGVLVEEFVGAVEGEGPIDLPGFGGEHADAGDGAAEVDVEVGEGAAPHPASDQEGLGQIEEGKAAGFEIPPTELEGGEEAAEGGGGGREEDGEKLEGG